MELQIEKAFDQTGRRWIVTPDGEVDISTAPLLRTVLNECFQERKADMVIDLNRLQYMDSTGLGVIIGAYGRMKEKGFTLQIDNPKDNIRKLLRITNLEKVLCPDNQ